MRTRFLIVAIPVLAFAAAAAAETVFTADASWPDGPPARGGSAVLAVSVKIDEGWHINSNRPRDPYLVPTTVALTLPPGWTAGEPVFPPHRMARFAFSDEPLAVFQHEFVIRIPVERAEGAAEGPSSGVLRAQACNDSSCLAPAEAAFAVDVTADAAAPARSASAPPAAEPTGEGGLQESFLAAGLLLQIGIVFLAGLALNLTPCVYPLIPITVGFFLAQKESSRARSWLLAVVYVLGMSVTYSALGVTAALTGRLFGAALQSVWVVGAIVVLLLALAASMFGLWEIRVPAWATRASGGRTGVGGALVMGLVVGLVAAPCIGPFVLGLLTYVGQQHDVALGFILFFALSMGLGLPYLFLAAFSGALERLPNSGAWMVGVRNLFGVLLIALATYFLRPFLPEPLGSQVFAGVLVLGGAYLLVIARPGHEQAWVDRIMRVASAGVLVAGVLLFPAPKEGGQGAEALEWQTYDQAAVTRALAGDVPVVMDFYADWCAPCKELEAKTFSRPEVAARLAGFARFKVDLTRSDAASDAIRQRFGVAGVPTIAFFSGGSELTRLRLTGFEPPDRFLARLEKVPAS